MRKAAAYAWMAAIVVTLLVADFVILTSSATVSRLARIELEKVFGRDLEYRELRASLDGVLVLEGVDYYATPARKKVFSADRVEIRFSDGLGSKPSLVFLDRPRVTLSDGLFAELAKMPPGKPLRERVGTDDLPRIQCRGGTVEFLHGAILRWDAPQAFEIRELGMSPVGPHRYAISGRLENPVFGSWRLAGEVDLATETTRFEVECEEIVLGPKIRQVLSTSIHPDWDRYAPAGRAGIRMTFAKAPGRDAEFKVTLVAKDMAITYAGFPYPVEHIEGEIDFFTNGFHVKYLHGRRGGTRIRFDGRATGYESEAGFKFRIDIEDMPLDAALRASLDEGGRKIWDDFHPRGWIDAVGWIVRDPGPDRPVRNPLHITFKNASMVFREFPYPIGNLNGEIDIESPDVRIKGIEASETRLKTLPFLGVIPERTRFLIHGTIGNITDDPEIDLTISATALPIDARLREALDPKTQEVWDDFKPRGLMDLEWRLTKDRGAEPEHRGVARLHHCRAFYREVPLWVTGITGEVHYASDRILLRHLEGRCEDAHVRIDGEVTDRVLRTRVETVGLKLTSGVRKALPKEVRDILETLKLQGTVSVDMQLEVKKGDRREIEVGVALKLKDGLIDTDVKIENIEQGQANFTVFINEKGTVLYGPIRIARARIEGKQVTDLSCSLNKAGSRLHFVNLQGRAYGGAVTGSFMIDTETKDYGGDFAVDRLDLREYSLDTESVKKRRRAPPIGKASVEIRNLRGNGSGIETLTGSGKLTITEGELWTVPVFIDIMSLDPTKWGKTRVFSAGTVYFDIAEKKFTVRTLAFQGEDVALLGKGTVDFDGNLDLKLRIESGSILGIDFILFKLPVRILDFFRDSFAGIRVRGTFEEPKVKAEFFPSGD